MTRYDLSAEERDLAVRAVRVYAGAGAFEISNLVRKLSAGPSTTKRWTLNIPLTVPSQNVVGNNRGTRYGRAPYRRLRDSFRVAIMAAAVSARVPFANLDTKRWVLIERFRSGREKLYDSANFVGGCKAVVDALVLQGLLADDDDRHAVIEYKQGLGKTPVAFPTVITIAEWEEG